MEPVIKSFGAAKLHESPAASTPQCTKATPHDAHPTNPIRRLRRPPSRRSPLTKHPLLFVALLSLLSVVAALIILHFSPGEQGGQLEGVAITQVSVLEEDGGEIPLSDGLSRRLVTLLRQYDRLSYSALPSYTPQPGDLLLTGPNHGTCFYLTADAPPTLVRVNHDGYSAAAKQSADGASLGEDPAYAQWRQDLAAYLSP